MLEQMKSHESLSFSISHCTTDKHDDELIYLKLIPLRHVNFLSLSLQTNSFYLYLYHYISTPLCLYINFFFEDSDNDICIFFLRFLNIC